MTFKAVGPHPDVQELLRTHIADLLALHPGLPPIVQAGRSALRTDSAPVGDWLDDATVRSLVSVMHQVRHAAPGVGLAANQLGLPLRLAVIGDPAAGDSERRSALQRAPVADYALLNPTYRVDETERTLVAWEGCLSVSGWMVLVPRAERIVATWESLDGQAQSEPLSGWHARIFQHETDHVNGKLCHDDALARSLCAAETLPDYGDETRRFIDAHGVIVPDGMHLLL